MVSVMTQSIQQPKELELLRQLIGEWIVGVAIKIGDDKVLSGCGEMSAVEIADLGINSELNMHIEGYDDYLENDLWSFDEVTGKVHLFGINSEGDVHDHVGGWKDDKTLELNWKGTYENEGSAEQITAKWLTRDQIEVKETVYSKDKINLTIDYVFKRKELAEQSEQNLR